jgi:indolepyruvate ferredoxin oxidoreductase alpha subunit
MIYSPFSKIGIVTAGLLRKDASLGTKILLSGNEAVAMGAHEAGVTVGCGYPGTPSTEILEALSVYQGIYCEWSVNEKVALEVALGASLAGARALVTMKHVGVNVAADPLFTAAYTGVKGGLVIVTADEPDMYSSQNEQDNRNYAIAAKIPMLEPSDAEEARVFTRLAFEMSERFDTPVFLRTTTRLSHSKSIVGAYGNEEAQGQNPPTPLYQGGILIAKDTSLDQTGISSTAGTPPFIKGAGGISGSNGFVRNPSKYVMIPAHARVRRRDLEARWASLQEAAESHSANREEMGVSDIGVITSGIPYTYIKEVMPNADILKLGLVHPLPRKQIERFAKAHKTVYIAEELDPVIETQVKSWGISCIGKEIFPTMGELSPDILRTALGLDTPYDLKKPAVSIPDRKPGLCPGCPHGHVFQVLRNKGMIITGDIGCYTLGTLPPFEIIDTCVDMGASITMAQGIDAATLNNPDRPKIAAVIGDSTFAHSGITGLLNACWNKREALFIVLDNATTAMTGMQPNPSNGERMGREKAPSLNYEHLALAFNIPKENFQIVDAYNKEDVSSALDSLSRQSGVRLLVVFGLCVIEMQKLKKLGTLDEKKSFRKTLLSKSPISNGGAHD